MYHAMYVAFSDFLSLVQSRDFARRTGILYYVKRQNVFIAKVSITKHGIIFFSQCMFIDLNESYECKKKLPVFVTTENIQII